MRGSAFAQKPNIVLVVADEMAYLHLTCHTAHSSFQVPNEELAPFVGRYAFGSGARPGKAILPGRDERMPIIEEDSCMDRALR